MAVRHGYGKIAGADALVFAYDTGDTRNSYKGEPTTNMWGIETGFDVNQRTTWSMPYGYNGAITDSVYSSGTWNRNRIWEVLHTAGTSGYAGYESWRLCVNQPTAGTGTYSTTRRVAIKICILEGSITDMALHTGGGNGSYNGANWTPIPESQVPRDCPVKTGWYQFLVDASWNSDLTGHCVGLGFISYNRVRILTTEPMYYPANHLVPFTGYQRSATQGLIDLTGNSTIDLTNVSFDSNAQMTFDGTDDLISIPMIPLTDFSITQVLNMDNVDNQMPIGGGLYTNGADYRGYVWFFKGVNQVRVKVDGETGPDFGVNVSAWGGKWISYTATRAGDTYKLYINGQQVDQTRTGSTNQFSVRTIGWGYSNSYAMQGDLAVTKIYNRALTADEVRNNYRHYKKRFNI